MIALPAPVALARATNTLTPPGLREPVWEPKWDGFRCLVARGRLWSRHGTDLTRFFPDLAPVLAARLPAGLILDGELVAWDTAKGRLDFASLQNRLTAGARLRAVAERRPAQLVAFDVLALDDDLRAQPLRARRTVLERALSGLSSPIVTCQQTSDLAVAEQWFTTLIAGGIEGLVIKDAASPYPTTEGHRPWWKVKAKSALDMVAIGFTGTADAPTTLVLAFPVDVAEVAAAAGNGIAGASERVPVAGSTTVLTKAVGRSLTPLLCPTGATFKRRFAWGAESPSTVTVIDPLIVEVSADAAAETGVLRHAARLIRARPDLQLVDLDI